MILIYGWLISLCLAPMESISFMSCNEVNDDISVLGILKVVKFGLVPFVCFESTRNQIRKLFENYEL